MNELLLDYLHSYSPLAIAFSGGIDSTVLALFCRRHHIIFTCFTVVGPHLTDHEIRRASKLGAEIGFDHSFFYFDFRHMPLITANSRDRCYYCKSGLFSAPSVFYAGTHTLADGTNFTDTLQYRPGTAALRESGFISPFAELGINRNQVLILGQQLGFNANIIDSRSCVLTRFAYGLKLDSDCVQMVRSVENYLLNKGLSGFRFRVFRHEGYLLQIDLTQKSRFEIIRPGFETYLKESGVHNYQLEFKPFDQISAHFDKVAPRNR